MSTPPRRASAVMVTTGTAENLRVLLVQRSTDLKFFGGYWAFPGGASEALDRKEAALASLSCGVRELLEETCLLPDALGLEAVEVARPDEGLHVWRALLVDLKARGLLDDTLVICTSEFGRQPAAQGSGKGRDHNAGAFTSWLAGGGIKAGTGYGATDELGYEAVAKVMHSWELHATALQLLGIDHEKLTWYHNGLEQRLTGFEGKGVIHDLIG